MLNTKRVLLGALLAGTMLAVTGGSARADHSRSRGRLVNRRQSTGARRAERSLAHRARDLSQEIQAASRRRRIGGQAAHQLSHRVDRVLRFLRHDRNLSRAEFRRRDDDLRHIERDFRHALRRGPGHHGGGRSNSGRRNSRRGGRF